MSEAALPPTCTSAAKCASLAWLHPRVAGTFAKIGSRECSPCPAGTFNSKTKQGACTPCKLLVLLL
jgi:hypothetical protein